MKKLSKLQKKWVEDHNGDDDRLDYLMSFLLKLKVFKKKDYMEIKAHIHTHVYEWQRIEFERRMKHNTYLEEKQSYGPPPRSIKPTRARSRY